MGKKLDLKSKKFGKWTVIGISLFKKDRRYWLCKCSCGNSKNIDTNTLVSGKSTQCVICGNREKAKKIFKDLKNKKFGEWVVLERDINNNDKKHTYWICLCSCGRTGKVKTDTLLSKKSTKCKKCKFCGEITGKLWGSITSGAYFRGIYLNITIEFISDLFIKQNRKCALSGLILEISSKNTTASLDRIDSSKGYVEDNVQWVHKHINLMKRSYEQDYFIKLCKKISEYNGEKNEL